MKGIIVVKIQMKLTHKKWQSPVDAYYKLCLIDIKLTPKICGFILSESYYTPVVSTRKNQTK